MSRTLGKCILALLIIAIVLGGMTEVTAWKASKFKLVSGNIVIGNEIVLQKPSQTLFHSQTHAAADTEALAIAFPATVADGGLAGFGGSGVDIAQTSDASVVDADVGFYKANWCFMAFSNAGGWPVGVMGAAHPLAGSAMAGADLIWPYMTDADDMKTDTTLRFKPYIDSSPEAISINASEGGGIINNTTATSPYSKPPALNTTYPQMKNLPKEHISNASTLERMYRNANLVNTVPKAYEGTVERPTYINPKPNEVLRPLNMPKIIEDSLNMTQPGTRAHTIFWDL